MAYRERLIKLFLLMSSKSGSLKLYQFQMCYPKRPLLLKTALIFVCLQAFCLPATLRAEEVWTIVQNTVPGYINADGTGPFTDLIKEVSKEAGVKTQIKIVPTKRAHFSIFNGKADIHFGFIEHPDEGMRKLIPAKYSNVILNKVKLYIYAKKKLDMSKLAKLRILIPAGYDSFFKTPFEAHRCRECAFKRVEMGREDGTIDVDELAAPMLKKMKLQGFKKFYFSSLSIKILFNRSLPEEVIKKIERGFIKTVQSGAYERILGRTANKDVVLRYKNANM